MTHSRRQLLDLLARHELVLGRALGQNYLADPNTARRIARLAGVRPGDRLVEIGAGLGSLTLALAESGAEVIAIELDRRVVGVLAEVVAGLDVTVVHGDALRLDWADVLGGRPAKLVANLPYNIAATLVLQLLEQVPLIGEMVVMVQREVGERLAAGPGSKAYGIPSVKRAWWADAKVLGKVPATVFLPQPKVESVLVGLARRPPPVSEAARSEVFALVDRAFGQRRKMLRRSLASVLPPGREEEVFRSAAVPPEARPEELDVHAWARLAAAISVPIGASPREPRRPGGQPGAGPGE